MEMHSGSGSVMGRVLGELRQLDVRQEKKVSAGAFQETLERLGVPLGTPQADAIVLQCRVESDGRVNFAPLEKQVMMTQSSPPAVIGAPPPRPATEKVARPAVRPPLPAESTPYESGHSDFEQEYRNGNINRQESEVQQREPLAIDTDVQPQLASHPSVAYAHLEAKERVKACTPFLREIFMRFDNGLMNVQQLHKRVLELGLEETPAFLSLIRSATMDMTFSQLFQSLLQVGEKTPKANQSGKFFSGASSYENCRSPMVVESKNSPWASQGNPYQLHPMSYLTSPNRGMRRKVENEHSTKSSIVFGEDTKTKQAMCSSEALKEQVYSLIRMLDQGKLTSFEFERQLGHIDLEVPNEVRRLLAKANADGTVNFQQFALAFDPLFRRMLLEERQHMAANPPVAPSPAAAGGSGSVRFESHRKLVSIAQEDHGDLIAWSQGPTSLEKVESETLERGRKVGFSGNQDHIDLSWIDPEEARRLKNAPQTQSARAPSREHLSRSDILSWDTSHRSAPPQSGNISYPFGVEYK